MHDLGSVRDSEPRAIPSVTADGRTEVCCSPARGQYASNLPLRLRLRLRQLGCRLRAAQCVLIPSQSVNAAICDHKDCERTDASPLELTLMSRERDVLETSTYYFCPEHRDQLFQLEESRTLPPEEWLGV